MPFKNFKYIILHHTAGNYTPNSKDLTHYQELVDGSGELIQGQDKTCSTAGMNSITYNIACCGRKDVKTPILPIQTEAMCKRVAQLCKDSGKKPNIVYTHAEIGEMVKTGEITKLLPNNSYLKDNVGKIDFIGLGKALRSKIQWYYNRIGEI